MAHSEAEWGQLANLQNAICLPPLMDLAAIVGPILELEQTQWPERVTADRYQPSDTTALVCVVF